MSEALRPVSGESADFYQEVCEMLQDMDEWLMSHETQEVVSSLLLDLRRAVANGDISVARKVAANLELLSPRLVAEPKPEVAVRMSDDDKDLRNMIIHIIEDRWPLPEAGSAGDDNAAAHK